MSQALPPLAVNLKRLRTARELSQKGLAEISGVSFRSIQNAEAGSTDLGAGTLIALADALEITVDELVRVGGRSPSTVRAAMELLESALQNPAFKDLVSNGLSNFVKHGKD
jgi:transcriptional regulator with XRE-family HTH domain